MGAATLWFQQLAQFLIVLIGAPYVRAKSVDVPLLVIVVQVAQGSLKFNEAHSIEEYRYLTVSRLTCKKNKVV